MGIFMGNSLVYQRVNLLKGAHIRQIPTKPTQRMCQVLEPTIMGILRGPLPKK